jgi:hypothetical protein
MSGYCQAWSLRSQCLFGGKCELCPYIWPHVPRCSKCGNYHRNPTEKCPQDYRQPPIGNSNYNLALDDAKGAVGKAECPDIFRYAIRLAIAAIEGLRRKG